MPHRGSFAGPSRTRWLAEAKRLFNEVRDTYAELGDELERVLIDNESKAQDIKLKQAFRERDKEPSAPLRSRTYRRPFSQARRLDLWLPLCSCRI